MKKMLAIMLAVSILFACLAVTSAADTLTPTLSVAAHNITFKDSILLKYAVKCENCTGSVSLLIWTSEKDAYTYGTQDTVITASDTQNIEGEDYKVFTYTGLVAKQMTDDVYARAYVLQNSVAYYSDVDKYSILDYAYSKMGKTGEASANADFVTLLEKMLDYGAAVQQYKGYNTGRLANASFYQIEVVGGTISTGYASGLYQTNDQVKLVAPAKDAKEQDFSYWKNSAGVSVGTTAEITVTVGTKNETYTAVYGNAAYSEGLEYNVDTDLEEASVIGIGTCTDTAIVIPSVYQEYPVTSIDANAFQNETGIVSVSIPLSVIDIGKKAFYGCTALKDVYYEGTKEEWDNNVTVAAYNAPLENATKHFGNTFTVTFVDEDGQTVLDTQSVSGGNDAVRPDDPVKDGYTFVHWIGDYRNITADTTVKAEYVQGTGNMFVIDNAYAAAGDTEVLVPIWVKNSPGITTAKLTVALPTGISLTNVTGSSNFTITGADSYPKTESCQMIAIHGTADFSGNFEMFVLHCTVDTAAVAGDYAISATFNGNDIANKAEESIASTVVNGKIIVK